MKRMHNGFTLAELLIVVAIIAVLVAISIPIFSSRLERSRESTDMANMRSAKAAVVVALLDDVYSDTYTGYFNAERGTFVDDFRSLNAYGKGTTSVGDGNSTQDAYNPALSYTGGVIRVALHGDWATLDWVNASNGQVMHPTADNRYTVYVGD